MDSVPKASSLHGLVKIFGQIGRSAATVDGDLKRMTNLLHPDVAEPAKPFDEKCD